MSTDSPTYIDAFIGPPTLPNPHVFICGTSGGGKSVALKLLAARNIATTGTGAFFIDVEGEYTNLTKMLGGKVIKIVQGESTGINPFEIEPDIKGNKQFLNILDKVAEIRALLATICRNYQGRTLNGVEITETEIVVNEAIELIKKHDLKHVLDIGTGSGCIACTIAKRTDATVLGVDISSDALRVALDNVTRLGINNRAVFRKSDLYEKIREDETFDIIISNPPYIPKGTTLEPEVMQEPSLALFAEENGLSFYRRIIKNAPNYLNKGGWLIFELGIGESEKVSQLMEQKFINIVVEKDLSGIDRVIYGKLKECRCI